jgi:hypothetical protein
VQRFRNPAHLLDRQIFHTGGKLARRNRKIEG